MFSSVCSSSLHTNCAFQLALPLSRSLTLCKMSVKALAFFPALGIKCLHRLALKMPPISRRLPGLHRLLANPHLLLHKPASSPKVVQSPSIIHSIAKEQAPFVPNCSEPLARVPKERAPFVPNRPESLAHVPPVNSPDLKQEEQAKIVKTWISEHRDDYVAHAIWTGNETSVIQEGAVLPGTYVLQKKGTVEFEVGSYGQRGKQESVQLTEKVKKIFETLDDEDEKRLTILKGKDSLTKEEKRELKVLERIKSGIYFNVERKNTSLKYYKNSFYRDNCLKKEFREDEQITSACCSYSYAKGNAIFKILTHKYEQWKRKGVPLESINNELHTILRLNFKTDRNKLLFEIRTLYNEISWNYGSCIVLRGRTAGIVSGDTIEGDRGVRTKGRETLLLEPWENKGEYFTLPLRQEHTLLIAPRKVLEPHADLLERQHVKFAYIENLSKEQADFFKVPRKLRCNS